VVGNFEYIEGEATDSDPRLQHPGKKEMGKFALETAKHVLSYYDKFSASVSYGKLDLIGLPDFSAGAMENTGLHHVSAK